MMTEVVVVLTIVTCLIWALDSLEQWASKDSDDS